MSKGHRLEGRALDGWLVAGARAGEKRLAAALVRRWQPRLVGHARRLLGGPGTEDVVQASWAAIWKALPTLREERAFGTFAYRIVSRQCARTIGRRQQRRALDAAVAAEPAQVEAPPEGNERERLAAAMARLSPAHQAALRLFYFEDMRVAEIAVALDVPPGTVKTRLMHGRAALRAALEGEGK
ncbi:RNA polymerase sigma factor [Sphingomicrobium aestuariivivum]|uniref:RNA polymerase sigma factor n=1 Tax=Sphingomicrobium aestuariivivum TaxID=1582356 RepID=UPI001FD6D734|nr:sigma-70 family RNA polymerase sigma factor [Sphingomicrobium aestuariivivum]MCJ8191842.1 sigma-70 family RNA polymerase sigma factor [Sphingomicrobium aestuariivivum]